MEKIYTCSFCGDKVTKVKPMGKAGEPACDACYEAANILHNLQYKMDCIRRGWF